MYCHSFLVTSVRGIGEEPTTAASAAVGCIGFMNAAFGLCFDAAFFFSGRFAADFAAFFFFVASGCRSSEGRRKRVRCPPSARARARRGRRGAKYTPPPV